MVLLFTALSFPPCRIDEELRLRLPTYIHVSQVLAAALMMRAPVLFGTDFDAAFDGTYPVEYRLLPSTQPTLTVAIHHREANDFGLTDVAVVEIIDLVVLSTTGHVKGGHSCKTRIAMAERAVVKMQESYGF